jgi:hypothetical protein
MRTRWFAATLGTVLALGVVLVVPTADLSAQANDPRIGTWKMNAAKSKFNPGPPPQSLTVTVESAAKGEKVTADIGNADGTRTTTVYTANFDGKNYPLTGSPTADTVSLKRVDSHTTERTDKKGDKIITTLRRVVSRDGKTMTVTTKGTNAEGQAVNNVIVFDKQ